MSQQADAAPSSAPSASALDAQHRAGAALRAAREATGRSSAELATQLKVARTKIDALEAGDWTPMHNASYARALLRAAAKALHTDPDAITGLLPPLGGELPTAVTMLPNAGASRPRRPWLIAALVLLALAAGVVLVPRRETRREPAPHTAASVAVPAAHPAASSTARAASAVQPRAAAPQPATSAANTAMPAPMGLPSAAASSPLQLQADAPSWIEVRDAQGKSLFRGIVGAGATQSLQVGAAQLPLRLTVGNAAHTHVVFRARPVPFASAARNVVHLELP